jgi:hypothetical protein
MLCKQSFFQHLQETSESDLIVSMTKHPQDTEVHSFFADPSNHINYREKSNVTPDSPVRSMNPSKFRKTQGNVGIGKTLSEHPEINRQLYFPNQDDSSHESQDDQDHSSSPSELNNTTTRKKLTQVNLSHVVKCLSSTMSTLSSCCFPINFPDSCCYNRSQEPNQSTNWDFSPSRIHHFEIQIVPDESTGNVSQ